MDRAAKQAIVESFRDSLKEASAIVLAEFHGFTVGEAVSLRNKFREQGVEYRVVKNTLAKRAIAGTDVEIIGEHLTGPTAWAYSIDDPVAPAKVLVDFLKDAVAKEHLKIKAGYLRGRALDLDEVNALAKLPGRDELRAKVLSLFMANATQLVRVLVARPVEFVNLLRARSDSLDE